MRNISLSLAAVVLAMLALPAFAQEEGKPIPVGNNLVSITITGTGMSKDEATLDAKRKAVEKGAGAYIYSQSQTKDFVLVRDTILSRAAGFVQSVEVKSARELEDGTWEVRITAVVSIQGIEDMWGVVQNMLKDMGRPKIMVFISEKIGTEAVETSTVQTEIEDALLHSGFILVDKNQIKDIDKKNIAAAVAEDKPEVVQAIAKQFGAQIFITGTADARQGNDTVVGGVQLSTFEAVANVRTFRSDTAQLISSIAGENARGVQRVSRSAAQQALKIEAQQIAGRVQYEILQHWQDVMEGRGEVQLHVENVTFKDYTALKKALAKAPNVKDVSGNFHNNTAEISIQSDLNAEKLAEKLADGIKGLDIQDVSQNVIKAKFASGN